MVTWDPLTKRYSLGIGVMRLASLILNRDDLNQIILPWLKFLRGETHETVALHSVIDSQRVCMMEAVSPLPIRMASGVVVDAAVDAKDITAQRRAELRRELKPRCARGPGLLG